MATAVYNEIIQSKVLKIRQTEYFSIYDWHHRSQSPSCTLVTQYSLKKKIASIVPDTKNKTHNSI